MKRPGRPALDANDPSVSVHIRMPGKQYDAACTQAQDRRLTVSEWIRQTIRRATDDEFRHQK